MIAKFFNTSKPIHTVIVAVFVFVIFIFTRSDEFITNFNLMALLKELVKFAVILSSVFVLDFLVSKNKLTRKNGYEILIYTLLIAAFPKTIQETNIFVSNLFIILALRRIISLRSNLNIKKKLFDAAFWICIAALFHFGAIIFLSLVVMALVFYRINDFKNWLIPVIAVITVALLIATYLIVFDNNFNNVLSNFESLSMDFSMYNIQEIINPLIIISLVTVWALAFYVINIKNIKKTQRPSFVLIFMCFLIGLIVVIVSPQKDGSELLFLFPSLTIILSNYLEAIKKPWLAEVFIWILLLTPFTRLMF